VVGSLLAGYRHSFFYHWICHLRDRIYPCKVSWLQKPYQTRHDRRAAAETDSAKNSSKGSGSPLPQASANVSRRFGDAGLLGYWNSSLVADFFFLDVGEDTAPYGESFCAHIINRIQDRHDSCLLGLGGGTILLNLRILVGCPSKHWGLGLVTVSGGAQASNGPSWWKASREVR